MLNLAYWLACLFKTLALLSLIIYLPQNKYPTQLTQGFLYLYLNETILFFVSFYVAYLFGEEQFQLTEIFKLVTNIYEVVICCGLVVWLVGWKKSLVTGSVQVMSIIVIIFTWLAVLIVGILAVASQDPSNIKNLASLCSGLAWTLCILKLLLQYNYSNTHSTLGPNFLFMSFTILWAGLQAFYEMTKAQNEIVKNVTIGFFAFIVCLTCLMMYGQRRDIIRKADEMRIVGQSSNDDTKIQKEKEQHYFDDNLRESLIDKLKRSDRTHYTSSFGESLENQ